MNLLKKINLYRKMNLTQRIILSFVTVAIITTLIGDVAIRNINKIAKNGSELYYDMTLPLKTAGEISTLVEKAQTNVLEMITQNDTNIIKSKLSEIDEITTELNLLQEEFKSTIKTPEAQQAYDEYLSARSENIKHYDKFINLCILNKDEEALAMFNGEMAVTFNTLEESLDNLVALKISDAETKYNSNMSIASSTSFTMIIYAILAVLCSIIIGFIAAKLISRPIKKLLNAANSISNNNLDINLDINSTSEIGLLADAFNGMLENLNSTISTINTASEQVASGSKQVADSSITLSQGATEQASSIEQLSDSIKEITLQANQSSQKRERAKTISTNALKSAKDGFSQMQDMVAAMNEIEESSRNISKIIKVIDEIAFQTNILALNAAVEAARAGQYGTGFAVVAEEVRNLAARSAEAAKETSELIENLGQKVDDGNNISSVTSNSLSIIVETFTEIDLIIKNISKGTEKQNNSLNQISQGIEQISDVVQANSATSEQTASASEELSSQAEMLKIEISKFILKNTAQNFYENNELDTEILNLT